MNKKGKWMISLLVLILVMTSSLGCFAGESSALSFSQPGGLYEKAIELKLSTNLEGMIRYTLDGSDPTANSTAYTSSIAIKDRTAEENNLSAIVVTNNKGMGGQLRGGQEQTVKESQGENNQQPANRPERGGAGGGFGGSAATPPTEKIFKGTVVKAAVFSPAGEQLTNIETQSYFVGEDIFTRYGDLPVISIVTDADNFFAEETGLYANANESGAEWERPAHFELFETGGSQAVSLNMGVRLSGNSTRANAQKSMRFYAKNSYDESQPVVEYEIFDGLTKSNSDDPLTTFKRVLLRNSGNDNSSTMFRDSLMQDLVSDLNLDSQASRPCVAFVNGEFWGIYNIRERYDDHYFANHYDIDTKKVAVMEISNSSDGPEVSEGDESDLAYVQEVWSFFENNSLKEAANYQKAQEYIDVDNFIDYQIANIYSGNTDWPANNNVFWRYKTDNGGYDAEAEWYKDGRYRWVLKDMDFGFGLMGQVSNDTLAHAMSEAEGRGGFGGGAGRGNGEKNENGAFTLPEGFTPPEGFALPTGMTLPAELLPVDIAGERQPGGAGAPGEGGGPGGGGGFTNAKSTLIFRRLLENEDFFHQFINRFCDVMNTNYDPDYVTAQIEAYQARIATAMTEQVTRYPSAISSIETWESNIAKMTSFVQGRRPYVEGFLTEAFSLGNVVEVSLKTDSSAGYLSINDSPISNETKGVSDPSSWSGSYFSGTTQTLTATPTAGHTFVKWIVTDTATGSAKEYTDPSIQVTLGKAGTAIQALFQ